MKAKKMYYVLDITCNGALLLKSRSMAHIGEYVIDCIGDVSIMDDGGDEYPAQPFVDAAIADGRIVAPIRPDYAKQFLN